MKKRTAILAERALTGPELSVTERPCVLVENGVILDILTRGEFEERKAELEVIDLGSRTLLPGMFECHNHLVLDARLPGHLDMMTLGETEHTVLALNGLKDDLMSGVTTARCMGDRYYLDVTLKRLIREGRVTGPDLLVCGIGMKAAHGHGYVGLPHSGAEEFRKTCRENMYRGVDYLKIFVTPGAPAKTPDSFIPCFLTREEIAAVVQEGASVGIPATAHCVGGKGLDLCIEEGVGVIEHLYSVTEAQVRRLETEFDGWVDMTSGIVLDPEREPFIPRRQGIFQGMHEPHLRKRPDPLYHRHRREPRASLEGTSLRRGRRGLPENRPEGSHRERRRNVRARKKPRPDHPGLPGGPDRLGAESAG